MGVPWAGQPACRRVCQPGAIKPNSAASGVPRDEPWKASMCGICGVLRRGPAPIDPAGGLVDRMTDSLAHRGPSDRGTWTDGRVALGARRLSVIDLSSAGHQPMANEDGTVYLVYNGEVYN